MMKKLAFTVVVSFFLAIVLLGQNKIPTTINKDTTLTKANSPYLIASNTAINPGVTLTIEAGVTIKFAYQVVLKVSGSLIVKGTKDDSVYFMPSTPGGQWGNILNNSSTKIDINYVKSTGSLMFVFGNGGKNIAIRHCNIESVARGNGQDCIAVEGGKNVTVEYTSLKGAGGKIANGIKNDAIDLDDCDSCFIGFNHVYNFSDDAVDIGTQTRYAYIHDNILNNTNYGVTVGESSKAYVVNNISYHNDGGFQVHTGATIYCENNTLYANTVGIEVFHSEDGLTKQTGGTAIMKNTIFYQSTDTDIYSQTSSKIDISYSLSDKFKLAGNLNIKADPLLVNASNGNFNLMNGSPCIKAGTDSLGNKIDIGAIGLPVIPIFQLPTTVKSVKKDNVYLFPNPAENYVQILLQNQNFKIGIATFFDVTGNEILKKEISLTNNTINIQSIPSGIYFVKIASNGYNFGVLKLIKK